MRNLGLRPLLGIAVAFLVVLAHGSDLMAKPQRAKLTISNAPDNPGEQWSNGTQEDILVLSANLERSKPKSFTIKHLVFVCQRNAGGGLWGFGALEPVDLYVNLQDGGFSDPNTTKIGTSSVVFGLLFFPNTDIQFPSGVNKIRVFLKLRGFRIDLFQGNEHFRFSLKRFGVFIKPPFKVRVVGHASGGKVRINLEAPAPPVITSPEDGSTLTTTDVAVNGTAAPDSTVRVHEGASLLGTGTATPTGTFQVLLTGLAQGDHSIFATAEKNGVTSAPSTTVSFSIDAEGPTVASLTPEDTATDIHIYSHVVLTFSEPLDPATVVSSNIFLSNAGTPVDGFIYYEAGSTQVTLSFEDGLDAETAYTVDVTAGLTDMLGNPATPFQSTFTTGTTPPPAPVILLPLDGAFIADTRTPTISGTAEPGATVRIYDSSTYITETTADPVTGAWSKTLVTDLEDGAYHFRARAVGSLFDYSNTVTVEIRRDTDGDGLSDADEVNIYGTDPTDSDTDGDGLSDFAEVFTHRTDPLSIDSSGDGWTDGYAVSNGFDPNNPDLDGDGILNGYDSNPLVPDYSGGTAPITRSHITHAMLPARNATMVRNVNVASGEFVLRLNLLTIESAGSVFQLPLTFRSMACIDGPVGHGWDCIWYANLVPLGTGMEMRSGFGQLTYFADNGMGGYSSADGTYAVLERKLTGGHVLKWQNKVEMHFSNGMLDFIRDGSQNQFLCGYDQNGNLTSVTDSLFRSVQFVNYPTGRLHKVIDWCSQYRELTFSYDSFGNMISYSYSPSAQSPFGATTSFQYDSDQRLVSIRNPDGEVITNISYPGPGSHAKVSSITNGVDTWQYTFLPTGQGNQIIARVTDPLGGIIEYTTGSQGNIQDLIERVKVFSRGYYSSEPEFYETTYSYNKHSEITQVNHPDGAYETFAFDQINFDPRGRGNLRRKTTSSSDTNDQDITETWTYDSATFQLKTRVSPLGNVVGNNPDDYKTTFYYDYDEALLGDLNGDGITSRSSYKVVKIVFPSPTGIGHEEETFEWNQPFGLLKSKVLANGAKCTIDYDANLYVKKIGLAGDSESTELNYVANNVGSIIQITKKSGIKWDFIVDEWGRTISVVSANSTPYERVIEYNSQGLIIANHVKKYDKNGILDSNNPWVSSYVSLDMYGNTIGITRELTASSAIHYQIDRDCYGRPTLLTFPEGDKERLLYDERGLLRQKHVAYGTSDVATTSFLYDLRGNLSQMCNPINEVIGYSHDGFGRQIVEKFPKGNYSQREYDLESRITSEGEYSASDVLLYKEGYTYSTSGTLSKIDIMNRSNDGQINDDVSWSYFYNSMAKVVRINNPGGDNALFDYDSFGRLSKRTDAIGNTREFAYDDDSRLCEITSVGKNTLDDSSKTLVTVLNRDIFNNVVKRTLVGGTPSENILSEMKYDSMQNLVETIDPCNNRTKTEFDCMGRPICVLRCADGINDVSRKFKWDSNGRLITKQDENGNCYLYKYNYRGDVVQITKPSGNSNLFVRNKLGHVTSETDSNGTVISYVYDSNGNVVSKSIDPATNVFGSTSETFTWDGLDRLTKAGNDHSTVEYEYDSRSNVESEKAVFGDSYETTMSYDLMGNMTSMLNTCGDLLNYTYDSISRVRRIDKGSSSLLLLEYFGQFSNIVNRLAYGKLESRIEIDEFFRPSLHSVYSSQESPIFQRRNVYNKNSERIETEALSSGYTSKVGLDCMSRVTSYEQRNELNELVTGFDLVLDGSSNCVEKKTSGLSGDSVENMYYSSDDELVSVGGSIQGYDSNGNLSVDKDWKYYYDWKGHLAQVERQSDSKVIAIYQHDVLGRRISAKVWDESNNVYEETVSVFVGNDMSARYEVRDSVRSLLFSVVNGIGRDNKVSISIIDKEDVDGDGDKSEMITYLYCHDSNNSVEFLTDVNGQIVERYDYSLYGVPRIYIGAGLDDKWFTNDDIESTESRIGNPFMWQGKEYDKVFCMYNFGIREFNPILRRFLQPDPREGAMSNPYAFQGNPLSWVDPTGMTSEYSGISYDEMIYPDSGMSFQESGTSAIGIPSKKLTRMTKIKKHFGKIIAGHEFKLVPLREQLANKTDLLESNERALAKSYSKTTASAVVVKKQIEDLKREITHISEQIEHHEREIFIAKAELRSFMKWCNEGLDPHLAAFIGIIGDFLKEVGFPLTDMMRTRIKNQPYTLIMLFQDVMMCSSTATAVSQGGSIRNYYVSRLDIKKIKQFIEIVDEFDKAKEAVKHIMKYGTAFERMRLRWRAYFGRFGEAVNRRYKGGD